MIRRPIYNWKCKDRTLQLGQRTLVMGILNVTPDSFSDGGDFSDPSAAVADGDHSTRVDPSGARETRALASAFNHMSEEIEHVLGCRNQCLQLCRKSQPVTSNCGHCRSTP